MPNTKVLFVDDDKKILNGIVRQQGDRFDIVTAVGPIEALKMIECEGPFAVVVSDMRMPEMNGVELLKRVRAMAPDTVRMILTGFAELDSTVAAVNEGHIFRFLAKPCDEATMSSSLQSALRQFALVEAERELVEGTLNGSIQVLAEVLALVNPLAFGQSVRVRATVDAVLKRVPLDASWQVEIAAMLSSLGCVALPAELLQKKFSGETLNLNEQAQFNQHPQLASQLIRNIPRLDEVSAIIAAQSPDDSFDSSAHVCRKVQTLRLALEFDFHEMVCSSPLHALVELRKRKNHYDDDLFAALEDFVKQEKDVEVVEIPVGKLCEGMVVAAEVRNKNGTLLITKGQRITLSALRILQNLYENNSATGPVKVVRSGAASAIPT